MWMGSVQDGTPDGPKLHSILVDPRDPAHLYFAMSSGGVHESLDRGTTWAPLVAGDGGRRGLRRRQPDVPRPSLRAALPERPRPALPAEPLRHLPPRPARRPSGSASGGACRSGRATSASRWWSTRATADTAWVFPMDGTTVWPRTSPGGKPSVYVTRNGGRTWKRLDSGLPARQAWWTVKRQAMTAGPRGARRPVLRHHERRAVGEPRRGPDVVLPRAAPARDLLRRSGRAGIGGAR